MFLEEMPLTPSGKVNYRALPAPEINRQEGVHGAEPESTAEKNIARIWRQLLKLDAVYLDDNFFDLGGHSLLIVQVSRDLTKSLGREIPVVDLFRYPTIAALAEFIGAPKLAAPRERTRDRASRQRASMGAIRRKR